MIVALVFSTITFASAETAFNKDLEALIKTAKSGFSAIEGDPTSELKSSYTTYKSTLPLSGFKAYILINGNGQPMFVGISDASSCKLDIEMLIMLPPTGFEVHDSDNDKTIKLPEGYSRLVYFKSEKKDAIVSIHFLKNNTFKIGITKFFT